MRLREKVAIVTGAGAGMGREMAILFASEGAKIIASDWNAETLKEVVSTVRAEGGEIVGIQGNVAVQSESEGLVDAAVNTYGRLDVLCNNAGITDLAQGVGEVTNKMWRDVLGVDLDGPMLITRRAIPIMLKQGSGSIINISSMAGLGGSSAGAAYTVAKHGLIGLTRNTAWLYAESGVRCNAICPGYTKTSMWGSVKEEDRDPNGAKRCNLYLSTRPRPGLQSLDIAQLALFLASDESRRINGAIIPADGGWRSA